MYIFIILQGDDVEAKKQKTDTNGDHAEDVEEEEGDDEEDIGEEDEEDLEGEDGEGLDEEDEGEGNQLLEFF